MTRLLWSLAWRAWNVVQAVRFPNRAGYHRMLRRGCLCGQRWTDSPRRCPIWGP